MHRASYDQFTSRKRIRGPDTARPPAPKRTKLQLTQGPSRTAELLPSIALPTSPRRMNGMLLRGSSSTFALPQHPASDTTTDTAIPPAAKRIDRKRIEAPSPTFLLPQHAAYDPLTKTLQSDVQEVAIDLENMLRPLRHVSKDLGDKHSLAIEMTGDPVSNKPTVGVFGRTGVGKSEVINAVTGNPGLQKAVAAGKSVTCCATQLVFKLQWQTSKYAVEVHLATEGSIAKVLKKWVNDYVLHHHQRNSELSAEDAGDIRDAAHAAEGRLRTLFCNKTELFRDNELRKSFFRSRSWSVLAIGAELSGWYHDLVGDFQLEGDHLVLRLQHGPSAGLDGQLEKFAYEREGASEPQLWPLVNLVIKVCPDSELLRYINLLDLPGMADTDKGRGNVAHEHFLRCQALWAVTDIGRVFTDEKLDDIMATYFESFGKDVAIIVTRSDEGATAATAQELQLQGADMANYWDATTLLESIKLEVQEAREQKEAHMEGEDFRALAGASARYDQLRDIALPQARSAQLDTFVQGRNAHVVKKLADLKQRYLADGVQLKVLCVSSTHWNDRYNRRLDSSNVLMSASHTNIPALRTHGFELAGDAKFCAMYDYVNKALGVVDSVDLWAAATLHDNKAPKDLNQLLSRPGEKLATVASAFEKKSSTLVQERLTSLLKQKRHQYRANALTAMKKIVEDYSPPTYRSFAIRHGNHRTNARTGIWNEELDDQQILDICGQWNAVVTGQKELFQSCIEEVINSLQDMFHELTDIADPTQIQSLQDRMRTYMNLVRAVHTRNINGAKGLDARLAEIKRKATKDHKVAYFHLKMARTYDACKEERGRGATKRMKALLGHALSDHLSCPFAAVTSGLEKDLNVNYGQLANQMYIELLALLDTMRGDLEGAFRVQKSSGLEMQACKEVVLPFLENNKEAIAANKALLREIKDKYKIKDDTLVFKKKVVKKGTWWQNWGAKLGF